MKLSILDQVPVTGGRQTAESLQEAEKLAKLGDEKGYHRIWYAEHHGSSAFVSSAPEILVAHMAAVTQKIRVGTGGIMMMHYSPLKIAEIFKTLAAFHPGRIDMGLGRAPGGDRFSMYALAQGNRPALDEQYDKMNTILEYVADKDRQDPLYQRTPAVPERVRLPEAWLLGSSGNSAVQAARAGMGYSFAQFFTGHMDKEVFDLYRHHFTPSVYQDEPAINVAFHAVVADSFEEAYEQWLPYAIMRIEMEQGRMRHPLRTPKEAREYVFSEIDKYLLAKMLEDHLVGTPEQTSEKLYRWQEAYGFDEAMIVSITPDYEAKAKTYTLLADQLLPRI